MIKYLFLSFALFGFMTQGFADQFHYSNILVGERAMGLGGAFTAVADDASGVLYNPAGVAFALSNDISGSANAFYKKSVVYKKAIGDQNFTENSGGSTAPFFGGLQKLDNYLQGLAFAFGIYNTDSELKDQNDTIERIESIGLQRFHRTTNMRANTTGFAAALGLRIIEGLAIGVGVGLLSVDELIQEYQEASYVNGAFLAQNQRSRLLGQHLESSIGAQLALGAVSFGLNLQYRSTMSESYKIDRDLSKNFDIAGSLGKTIRNPSQYSYTEPQGGMPMVVRFGMAWFVNTRLLWTADANYYSATEGKIIAFKRKAVTNFASGLEYYLTPSVPVRFGVFTNNDARPNIKEGRQGQGEHIDYLGGSVFFALVQPNSQIAVGGIYQSGSGKAQKIDNTTDIQDVEAESITVAFSATHSF